MINDGTTTHVDRGRGSEHAPDITAVHRELEYRCKWTVWEELGSDHKLIIIEITGVRDGKEEKTGYAWAWKRDDWKKYEQHVQENIIEQDNRSLREKIDHLNEVILQAATKSIPKKKVSVMKDLSGMRSYKKCMKKQQKERRKWKSRRVEESKQETRRNYQRGANSGRTIRRTQELRRQHRDVENHQMP